MYLAAEKAVLSSQSYEIEGLRLTRANLADIQRMIRRLEGEIAAEERRALGVGRARRVVPVDW